MLFLQCFVYYLLIGLIAFVQGIRNMCKKLWQTFSHLGLLEGIHSRTREADRTEKRATYCSARKGSQSDSNLGRDVPQPAARARRGPDPSGTQV